MSGYLIDTNIITAIFKKNASVVNKIQDVILYGEDVLINGICYYEIKRGLLASGASTKLSFFEQLCKELGTIWLGEQNIFDEASLIYSELKKAGHPIEDADILIGAMAKAKDMILVSDDGNFQYINNLKVENWK